MTKTAMISGGAGFIGRNLSRKFTENGWNVFINDIKVGVPTEGLFLNEDRHFDCLIHCAALIGGREGIEGSRNRIATYNTMLDALMFDWTLRNRPDRVVYMSSSAAYPTILQTPGEMTFQLQEDDIDLEESSPADSSYGETKLIGERLAQYVSEEVPVTIVRPFSGYGADQDLTYPFPTFLRRAVSLDPEFEVWGDGEQVRDFVHVSDISDCIFKMVTEEINGPVNIGTGRPTSFNQLARLCMDAAGTRKPLSHDLSKPVGVAYRVADTSRLNEFFAPKISLEQGIAMSLESRG
jgi:nucleoside-diphosphate-sugar epimerase